jgi:hypothetical protein
MGLMKLRNGHAPKDVSKLKGRYKMIANIRRRSTVVEVNVFDNVTLLITIKGLHFNLGLPKHQEQSAHQLLLEAYSRVHTGP